MMRENFSNVIHNEQNGQKPSEFSTSDTETGKEMGIRKCQNLFLSSAGKVLLILLLCALFFSFGVLMTRLTHNQNQFSLSFQNSTSQNTHGKVAVDVDPCDDFYEFACASVGKEEKRKKTEKKFALSLQLILGFGDTGNRAEEKAQNFYRSCVNAATNPNSMLLNEHFSKLFEKLEKVPQGNLQEKLELFQSEHGFNPFFTWSITRELEEPNSNFITIKSGLGDPEEEKNFTSLLKSSDRLKNVMAEILGQRLNFTTKSNDFDQLVNLDREIRELSQPSLDDTSESEPELNRVANLTQLQNFAGFINWKSFFNSVLEKHNVNLTIKGDVEMVSYCSQFLSRLSKKLNQLESSGAESQKLLDKFWIWQAGKKILGKILSAIESPVTAPQTCSTLTMENFELAVISMHRRHVLKQTPDLETGLTESVQKMAENIRQELILLLKEADWLDDNSREGAIEKARKIQVIFGYPDDVKNSTALEQLYGAIPKISESDFIGNMMTLLKFQSRKNLEEDPNKKILETTTWEDALENNAFYHGSRNSTIFPARNLLPPHFNPNPESSESIESVNYGRLGLTIGHEFFHAFANSGSYWDDNAQFQKLNLWKTKETRKEVENRYSCLVRQYSKFSYPDGKSLNGTYTLEENVADNGGLDIATRALFRLLNKRKVNRRSLGKTEYTKNKFLNQVDDKKMFFISVAQSWCTDEPPQFSKDPHSPEKFRVLGALQNSKAFSNAFQCHSKSRMNPQEKCTML